MGNVSLEYHKICKPQVVKHVGCGLEGQLKFQDSDVGRIVLEEAVNNLESGWFATLFNHFDHVDGCCGIIFALHQAMPASSVLNGSYPCYALLIDTKQRLQLACWLLMRSVLEAWVCLGFGFL